MYFRTMLAILLFFLLILLAGCRQQPSAAPGFVLPKGDPELGRQAFLGMRCYDCHMIPGVQLPVGEEPNQAIVILGGEVSKVKNYHDLVTSLINPSHRLATGYNELLVSRDGKSNMTNYNDAMTVSELINLVAFLQTQYKEVPAPAPDYSPYY